MEDHKAQILKEIFDKIHSFPLEDTQKLTIIESLGSASVRPLRVIWECLMNGEVSTETLQDKYGYNQPPRAARDVRELGFELQTQNGTTKDGRRMAIYTLVNLSTYTPKIGRVAFKKSEKDDLVKIQGSNCYFCKNNLLPNELQIDHKIPFEVAGNAEYLSQGIKSLILLCASCNRSKSWSCEKCINFAEKKLHVCRKCYWFDPIKYQHVRTEKRFVLNRTFDPTEIDIDKMREKSPEDIDRVILNALKEMD